MTTALPPDPAASAPRRTSPALRFGIAFIVGLLLVVLAGGGALYAYGQQYAGRVLPGVHVAGTDLSGRTPSEAREVLRAAYASLGEGAITLAGPDGETRITYAEIGRAPDVNAMIETALGAGRRGEAVADLFGAPSTALRGVTLVPRVTWDHGTLAAAVAGIAAKIDRDAVDATLVARDGEFRMTESVEGRVVDQPALLATLETRLSSLDAPAELHADIPFTTDEPAVTTAEAEAARAAAERMSRDLVLTRGTKSWTIRGSAIRPLISFAVTADGGITPVLDQAGIRPLLKDVGAGIDTPPANATFRLSGGKVLWDKPSRDGVYLSRAGTEQVVLDALAARQAGADEGPLSPVVIAREAGLTTEQAKEIAPRMRLVSKHTTYFPIAEKNGFGANIWIPASIIDGYVLGPGETFDFWKAVGPVTREKGYRQGGAIINGKTEPQGALAGGICSCSTTLFNAALKAGFEMGDRRNHYYYIDRYPLGLDATVFISASGSKQTMSFTNDTEYPVLIRGTNTRDGSRGYVTFRIYSVPSGRTVRIDAPIVKNRKAARDTTQYTSALPAGTTKRIEYPVEGKDVWRTVRVYQDGVLKSERTYYSHYSVITGITLVGTGGAPAPGASASPSPSPSP